MNDKSCPHEDSVAQAMRTGQWSEGLRSHLSQCENCAEVEQVSRWMGSVAGSWGGSEPVPDPSLAWLKAQLAEQQRLEERALRPVILAQAVAKFGLLVAVSFLILWIWPVVNMFIGRLLIWMPDALINPSLPSIKGPMAYLTSPALVLLALALGYFFLQPRLRRAFEMK